MKVDLVAPNRMKGDITTPIVVILVMKVPSKHFYSFILVYPGIYYHYHYFIPCRFGCGLYESWLSNSDIQSGVYSDGEYGHCHVFSPWGWCF